MLTLISAAFAQTLPPPPVPAAAPAPAPAPKAAPGPAPAIRAAVDQAYGKPVPAEAVCVETPTFEAPFVGQPTPVGVLQANRGCVLLGVMVNGAWQEPAKALSVAVDRPAWDALSAADRSARILQWNDQVLHAFDVVYGSTGSASPAPSPTVPGKVTPSAKGFTVERRLFRRADRAGGTTDLTEKATFDANLVRTGATDTVHGEYTSSFVTRPEKVAGLSQALVEQILTTKGKVIRDCFLEAWAADPTIDDRVTLAWTVAAGKVDPNVAVVATPGDPPNDALAKCYARHVRASVYPPEANGTATWVFWIDRRDAASSR